MPVGTASGLRAYADARGVITPALGIDSLVDQALVRANDYIQSHYIARFYDASLASGPNVEAATYEAALYELDKPGFWTKVYTPGERKVLTEMEGIRWTLLPSSGDNPAPVSTRIDALLSPYLRGGIAVLVV